MSYQPTQPNFMERRLNHIARHEPTVQAFVDGTFDNDRVLDAIAWSDQRLALNGLCCVHQLQLPIWFILILFWRFQINRVPI